MKDREGRESKRTGKGEFKVDDGYIGPYSQNWSKEQKISEKTYSGSICSKMGEK